MNHPPDVLRPMISTLDPTEAKQKIERAFPLLLQKQNEQKKE